MKRGQGEQKMIEKINRGLRTLFVVIGVLFVLTELLPEGKVLQDNREGFDAEEFDDIW